jgi:aryl-alcohol dehydrogenase-like predicted oxidoreductase
MKQRILGDSGLAVGAIGLGCMGMTWSYSTGAQTADRMIKVIHRAIDLGVTLIDTADVYGPFTNETLVGRALAGRRDDVILATKCGLRFPDDAFDNGILNANMVIDARPDYIRAAVDASLQRLAIDHIDLYQLHRVDPNIPLEDSWGAFSELVTAGKVRYIGLSEATVAEAAKAHAIHPVSSIQSELSLWRRAPLADVVPWTQANDVAFIPFSPLGRGLLTGAITGADDLAADDRRRLIDRFAADARTANQAMIDIVSTVADRHGVKPAQIALAWTLAQGEHVVPIPGTKRIEFLEENAAAADLTLTAKDLDELNTTPAPTDDRP